MKITNLWPNEIFLSYSESKKNIKLIYKGEFYEKNIES